MGLLDRSLSRLRQAFAPALLTPTPAPTRDVIDNPNDYPTGGAGTWGDWGGTQLLFNALTSFGTPNDPSWMNRWLPQRMLRRSELFALGRNALSFRAINLLGATATSEGWKVVVEDDRVSDKLALSKKVADYERKLALPSKCARAISRGRQYGDAIVLLGIDDSPDGVIDFCKPVNPYAIRSIKWAVVLDRRDFDYYKLASTGSNEFGEVEIYQITDINGVLEDGVRYGPTSISYAGTELEGAKQRGAGQLLVHASRVLSFRTVDGYSTLDTLQDSLAAYIEAAGGIKTAARESQVVKYKVGQWAKKTWNENAGLAYSHMSLVDKAKNSYNAWVLGDGDDVDRVGGGANGVDKLINPFMVWLAAALGVPVTVFWGVSPGGFGKGEAERQTWHESVYAFQTTTLEPQLTKVHGYILGAWDGPRLDPYLARRIEFADLSPPDETTRADLRSKVIEDITRLKREDIITRDEARASIPRDDQFDVKLIDIESDDKGLGPMQVGAITGSVAILQAVYPQGVPVSAARVLQKQVDPQRFTPEIVAEMFPEAAPAGVGTGAVEPEGAAVKSDVSTINAATIFNAGGQVAQGKMEPEFFRQMLLTMGSGQFSPEVVERLSAAAQGGPDALAEAMTAEGLTVPTDGTASAAAETDDDESDVEGEGEGLTYSSDPIPSDTMYAADLAELFGLTRRQSGMITRAAREGKFRVFKTFGNKPRFSRAEVEAAWRKDNGLDGVPDSPTTDAVRDWSDISLCVVIRAPDDVARQCPYKPQDTSPPHITLAYVHRCEPEQLPSVVDVLVRTFALLDPFDVEVPGTVDYFEVLLDDERGSAIEHLVAYATVGLSTDPRVLHREIADAIESAGCKVKHYTNTTDFTPHLTLGYLDDLETYTGPVPRGSWRADSLEIWYGAERLAFALDGQQREGLDVQREVRQRYRQALHHVVGGAVEESLTTRDEATADGFFKRGSDPEVYTKPKLRNRLRSKILREGRGGDPGEWSARKAQLLALEYKRAGGGYRDSYDAYEVEDYEAACEYVKSLDKSEAQQSLEKWTQEEWKTCLPSGPSNEPAGSKRRYLPERACEELSPSERAATNRKKAEGARKGKQFVANTEAAKTARGRATDEVEGFASACDECDDFDEDAFLVECRDLSEEAKEERIAEAYKKYHDVVNMGAAALRAWAKTPWSKKASVDRTPIERNLRLLETPREEWTLAHASSALRTVNFVSRMRGNEKGKPVKIDGREGPSKRDISLKNWAFDPNK